jgi:DNA-binding NtrC family response regulator
MSTPRILVVDDEPNLRRVVQVQLQEMGYRADTAASGAAALEQLRAENFQLLLTDLRMPGMSGVELLKAVRQEFPEVVVIIMTAFGSVETAVEAMKSGAYHYITKPVRDDELKIVVDRTLEHCRLMVEVNQLRDSLNEKYGFENIIGRSNALLSVLDIAARAARSSSTVLIEGETGTGKELLARAIHFNSPRSKAPFLALNCGAIPRDLLESELFGHRKGAFTGAVDNKRGKVEAVDGGTLFLDEIGEMPLDLQVKMLRLVQNGELEKVGAIDTVKVDVRIVAATNRGLLKMVEDGLFREDLYYRLAVIPMTLPPLRQRPEDIPDLVRFFFEKSLRKHGRDDLSLPDALLPYFSQYRWPGNIRELENAVERITVLSRGPQVVLSDLPEALQKSRQVTEALDIDLPPGGISLDAVERELIRRALERFDWNQTRAARYLDLSRKTLIYRMEKHGLTRG